LKTFFLYNFFSLATLLIWQYIAMVYQKRGFNSIIEIRGYHAALLLITTTALIYIKFGFSWQKDILHKCLKYSIGLLPFVVINWGQLYIDRWYMQSIKGAFEVGIYTFYLTIALIHATIADAYENAWRPNLIQQLKDGVKGYKAWNKNANMYLLLNNVAAAFAVVGTVLLPYVIDMHQFQQYLYIIFPIMILASLKSHLLLFLQPLVFLKKSLVLSIFVSLQLIILLLCYFIWLKIPNLNTLLIINIIVIIAVLCMIFTYTQMTHKMPYTMKMFWPSILFILCCFAGWHYSFTNKVSIVPMAFAILGIQLIPFMAKVFNIRKMNEVEFQ